MPSPALLRQVLTPRAIGCGSEKTGRPTQICGYHAGRRRPDSGGGDGEFLIARAEDEGRLIAFRLDEAIPGRIGAGFSV